MKIDNDLKAKIKEESNSYLKAINETSQYGNLTPEQRDELGAFFTPPELCIQMLEMFNFDTIEDFAEEDILDPTCGSGNLIMAALIVGSSVKSTYPEKVFGNELSETTLKIARKRFVKYCSENGLKQFDEKFWEWHLHQGDALDVRCITKAGFTPGYKFLKSEISNEEYLELDETLKGQYSEKDAEWVKGTLLNKKKVVKTWKLK